MVEKSREYFLGLDLGQKQSNTAIVIVERSVDRQQRRNPVTMAFEWEDLSPVQLAVRHAERVDLGTSYVDIVDKVKHMVWRDQLRGRTRLIVDATGAGAPVVDLFRKDQDLKRACELSAVTITSGDAEHRRGPKSGDWFVAKQDLMMGLLLLVERQRLVIAQNMPESARLVEELVRYGRPGDDSFQDDLVLALALAVWKVRFEYPESGGDVMSYADRVRKGKMTARDRQSADEFIGMIMGIPASRYR